MQINKKIKPKKMTLKNCKFPDCGKEFYGVGSAKYCMEHRSKKARSIMCKIQLNEKKELLESQFEESNIEIIHNYSKSTKTTLICSACGNEYEINLYPNTTTYPKFCELHRNQFKRNQFIKNKCNQ